MRIASGPLFAAGLVLSSLLAGCVVAESTLDEVEELDEAQGAVMIGKPTMLQCYQNHQNDTAGCYEIDDLSDHQLCLELAEQVFQRCRREASDAPLPEGDDQLITGGNGGGFVPGFSDDSDPWVIVDP